MFVYDIKRSELHNPIFLERRIGRSRTGSLLFVLRAYPNLLVSIGKQVFQAPQMLIRPRNATELRLVTYTSLNV